MKQNNATYVNLTFYEKELFCKHKAVLLILVEKSSKYPSIKLELKTKWIIQIACSIFF